MNSVHIVVYYGVPNGSYDSGQLGDPIIKVFRHGVEAVDDIIDTVLSNMESMGEDELREELIELARENTEEAMIVATDYIRDAELGFDVVYKHIAPM